MVLAPSLLTTRPCGIAQNFSTRNLGFEHLLARELFCRIGCGDQFGKLTSSPLTAAPAAAVGRSCGPGAVRMSSTPVDSPSVAPKDGDADTKTVHVIINGKVQGVYYRNWTVDSAQQLSVNGWVRNLKDGSVEAVFSGKSASIDSLVQKCYSGPSAARVSNVEVSAWQAEVPQGFQRKPTIW